MDKLSEYIIELILREEKNGLNYNKKGDFKGRRVWDSMYNLIIVSLTFRYFLIFRKTKLLEFKTFLSDNNSELLKISLGAIIGGSGQKNYQMLEIFLLKKKLKDDIQK